MAMHDIDKSESRKYKKTIKNENKYDVDQATVSYYNTVCDQLEDDSITAEERCKHIIQWVIDNHNKLYLLVLSP